MTTQFELSLPYLESSFCILSTRRFTGVDRRVFSVNRKVGDMTATLFIVCKER